MRTSAWLPCVLTALLAIGCTSESEPPPEPPTATETPIEEDEEPADVAGAVESVDVADLSIHGSGLYPHRSAKDEPVPIDEDAIDAVAAAAVDWVDTHLSDVQAGGDGLVADVGLHGDPTPVSQGMGTPEHPITEAVYTVTVGARGAPEWVRVGAIARREDGSMSAQFVFLADGGDVSLLAVQPGNGTPVAAP